MVSVDRHLQYFLAGLLLGIAVMPGALWLLGEYFSVDVVGIAETGLTDYYRVFYSRLDELENLR